MGHVPTLAGHVLASPDTAYRAGQIMGAVILVVLVVALIWKALGGSGSRKSRHALPSVQPRVMQVPDHGYSPWTSQLPQAPMAAASLEAPSLNAPSLNAPNFNALGLSAPAPSAYAPATPGPAFPLASPGGDLHSPADIVVGPAPYAAAPPTAAPYHAGPPSYASSPQHGYVAPSSTPYIASYYREPTKTRRGYWIAAAVVVALAAAGFTVKLVASHSTSSTLPAGNGVAAGDPTTPPAGPGQVYTSADGHFAVRFASTSNIAASSDSGTDVGIDWTLTTAVDAGSGAVTGGGDLSQVVTSSNANAFLRAAFLDGLDGVTQIQLHTATFRGRPALTGSFVDGSGVKLYAAEVLYGSPRVYLMAATSTATLSELEKSFVALP